MARDLLYAQSHRQAVHTKAFDYPVAEHWGKAEMFSPARTRTNNTSAHSWPPASAYKHDDDDNDEDDDKNIYYRNNSNDIRKTAVEII